MSASDPLDFVRRAVRAVETDRAILEQRIQLAHDRGLSLRAIAEAANMSHEQVRRILAR